MADRSESKTTVVDDDIVISGISGIFPRSRNVKEFESNLYNKVNMVNDDESRWIHTNPLIPRYSGKIPDLSHFDPTFFGVHQLQADNMDPQNRLLIEESFKAIMDAGVNPFSLRGSNTGVFMGICVSESENHFYYNQNVPSGFGITGSSKAMFANRISYILGLNGPSLICDTACSSSMYALELAYHTFRRGEIDAAIVGGANLCLHPNVTAQFAALGVLSSSGQCCPFDARASGYIRSEAVSCIFLQRKSAAKRVYASVINCLTNCDGYKPQGVSYPSSVVQEKLLRQLYSQVNFDFNELGYLEAHSTGTVVGDPEECKAIDNAICKKRREPLLVGSVKSNCGHAEASSAMCSFAKVIFAMQNDYIPANINFESIRTEIEALKEGRLKVVSEPIKLVKPYVGINSFGFGGANAHALLKRFDKEKHFVNKVDDSTLARIVTWSSRTEENVKAFFAELQKGPLDPEYLGLIQNSQAGGIQGMVYRGYAIFQQNAHDDNPTCLSQNIQHNSGMKRPLVWVFSGMGSQWTGMGKSLIQLPLFKQSIQSCHNILKPLGMDLINVITSNDPEIFNNILHSFVGIAAIQIALVDVLRDLGLKPDFLIGHSFGELGCAYADESLTAEQVILAAYYRGKVSLDAENTQGSMAAIGMGFKKIQSILPEAIEVACHNSGDSCTISGPAEDVAKFVEELETRNVFAREVPCSNIAYHSRYIAHLGPQFLEDLKRIIPTPKPRSNKWISSSIPKDQWSNHESKYSSAEYHTNNLLNSVLFEEALASIPTNALTIEIAPHALLQSILKSARSNGTHIGLTKRKVEDGILFFLNSLGGLYTHGLELSIDKLYPEIKWPVSRGTPCLSHLIEFDHSRSYFVYKYEDYVIGSGTQHFSLKLSDKYEYLRGHEIDSRVLVPATFYLESVWRTFAAMKGVTSFCNLAVEFENVNFVRATALSANATTDLVVVVQKGTGRFEVTEADSLVASGTIREMAGTTEAVVAFSGAKKDVIPIKGKDFYKELKLRGYHYHGEFQGIEMVLSDGSYGKLKWTGNWVTFIDCMLQLSIVSQDSRNLKLPTKIRTLRINPQCHREVLGKTGVGEIFSNEIQKSITAGGIEIIGLTANTVQRRKAPSDPVLERYQFVPYLPAPALCLDDIARCCVQLLLENQPKLKLQIVEFSKENQSLFLASLMRAIRDLPLIAGSYMIYGTLDGTPAEELDGVTHISPEDDLINIHGSIVVITGRDSQQLSSPIIQNMEPNGFLISKEKRDFSVENFDIPTSFKLIASFPLEQETFVLMQKGTSLASNDNMTILEISSTSGDFQWIEKLQEMSQISKNIVLVAQNEKINGLMGLVNCLRKEPGTNNIKCVIIEDTQAPPFDINTPLYKSQLQLGLAVNVYRKGHWGSYRHLLLKQEYPAIPRVDNVFADILRIGDFASIRWLEGSLNGETITAKVVYSSLNFRDIMLASGRLPIEMLGQSRIEQRSVFGFEFSGVDVQSGDPIMGMVVKSAVSSHLPDQRAMYWNVPDKWTLREAATVPVVYLTVYLAFFLTADIRKGRSILIHAGSGGVGLAAIRVALAYGLEVFTTVSTTEKKSFLLRKFPALNENNIGNSRDTSFEAMVMERTKGKGVDFVLNSLSEEKLLASVRCLGKKGHFLEIGKFDMANDNCLAMGAFLNELSFHAVLVDNLLIAENDFVEKLKELIKCDIENGIIIPLPSTVFPAPEVEQSFRYLMSGKHIGKVLLQIRENPAAEVTLPISVLPQVYFSADLVWIICGGLGGFGLELVDWMVLRGARKVVLSSSRGLSNDYQRLRIGLWRSYSTEVTISTADIGTEVGCSELLRESMKQGPIGGIFNLAVVLKDGIFANQTAEQFQQSFKPKVYATKHLDQLSRKLCPNLKQFVVFSSISCGRGNAGQTNYGMANSLMERIIEDRVAFGLPGKAIQWGAVGEVGLVAEMAAGKIDLEIGGTLQQRISSCLDVLDTLLSSPDTIVSSMVVAEKRKHTSAQSPVDSVLNVLGIRDIKLISMNTPLAELGMDSLVSVEIKQTLENGYNIWLSTSELRSLTFAKLIELSENSEQVADKTESSETIDYVENLRLLYSGVNVNWRNADIFDHVNDVTVGAPIIIFPGIEGCSGDVWRKLGSKLSFPTYVLQFREKSATRTLKDMVQFSYKHVTQLLQEKHVNDFKIVAYSFGTIAAHLILDLLEKAGYRGKLLFIDGSAPYLGRIVNSVKSLYTEDGFEKIVLGTVLSVIIPELSVNSIYHELHDKKLTGDYLIYIREMLEKRNIDNINNVLEYIEAMLLKMKFIKSEDTYTPTSVIYSALMLVKPTIPIITNFDEFYGLGSYTLNFIQTEVLEGNHRSILENDELPNIINQFFNAHN